MDTHAGSEELERSGRGDLAGYVIDMTLRQEAELKELLSAGVLDDDLDLNSFGEIVETHHLAGGSD